MEDSMEWSGDDPERVFSPAPSHESSTSHASTTLALLHRARNIHPTEGSTCGGGGLDPPTDHPQEAMMMDSRTSCSSEPAASSSDNRSSSSSGRAMRPVEGGGNPAAGDSCSSSSACATEGSTAAAGVGGGGGEFLCYECGLGFRSVKELQLHMVRKTAWSNQGLIGCRVSCLVDNREWHEGLVTQYHKSGKHCVEYRRSGEKRWVNMLKTAFYIVERAQPSGGEVKEMEPDPTEGLAPVEKWHFQEDVTPEFCVSLSLLHRAYGCRVQETGHKTVGHTCVTDRDKVAAREVKGSLLYGELLPRGVNKAMGPRHLNAPKASTIYDLGMGTGKVAMQVFLQFPNLKRVYGIELSQARFELGEAALFALMELQPGAYAIKEHIPGQFMAIETVAAPESGGGDAMADASWQPSLAEGAAGATAGGGGGHICRGAPGRTLEFACGNLFDVANIAQADLVLLETDVSSDVHPQLSRFLSGMRKGAQALTYLDLRKMWSNLPFPFRQVEVNRSLSDRFPTSWSVHRGHHFFLWSKILPSLEGSALPLLRENDELLSTALADRESEKDKDKLRDGQGVQLSSSSSGLRRGVGISGSGRDEGSREGCSGVGAGGSGFSGSGRGGTAPGKGRRGGHPKLRFPFMSCLGFGRRDRESDRVPPAGPPVVAGDAAVPASAAIEMAETSAAAAPRPRFAAGDGPYPLDTSTSGSGRSRPSAMAMAMADLESSRGAARRPSGGSAECQRRPSPPPPPPPCLGSLRQGSSRGQVGTS
eukprot:g11358.t1